MLLARFGPIAFALLLAVAPQAGWVVAPLQRLVEMRSAKQVALVRPVFAT